MDIWIILDGEKTGPLHDYEIRSKISHGELPGTTPAWHEGLPGWKPLAEIALFQREFERPPELPETPAAPPAAVLPPALPTNRPLLVRRFFARWFDLYLYAGLWWFGMWALGAGIGALLLSPWVMIFQFVPWFVLETILLHRFGCTPGKWLLGLQVLNDDGSRLTLKQATRRSALILFIGMGFAWGPLTLLCQLMAFLSAMRFGRPLWDHAGGHRLTAATLRPPRIVTYVLVIYAAIQLQWIVVAPYVLPVLLEAVKPFPALREQLEKNPPWQLPPRR